MARHNTSHSPDNGNESTHAPNTYVRSKARVFFVRHGKSMEDSGGIGSIPQSNEATLDHRGIRQMKAVGIYLKIAGITGKDGSIMYGNDTVRVTKSVEVIVNQLIQGNIIKKDITDKLRTTQKGLENEDRIMENGEVFVATVALMKQIRKEVNNPLEKSTIFILVGHKSNKSGSEQAADNINEAIDISFDIENGGIIERDIDEATGKYIDPKKHPETLFVNRANYKEVLESLEDIIELNELIMRFRENTQIESGKYPIWELQNYVNAYFVANKKLYEKYLNSSSIAIRLYCIANLLKEKNYPPIGEYYLSQKCKSLPIGEKLLLIEHCNNHPEIKHLIQKLFILRSEFWKDEDQAYIEKSLGSDFYQLIKRNRETYEMATELQGFSLDEMIQEHQEGSILSRDVFYWQKQQKKTGEEGYNPEEEKIRVSTSLEQIIQSGGNYILRAHVGQGKSFWITELTKYASLRERQVFFYKAKDLGMRSEKQVTDLFASIPESAILCIDAIDEIHSEKKEGIKKLIASYRGTCIITARESEYPEDTTGYTTLSLVPMDAEEFLESRFQNEREKLVQVREILEHNHLESEVIGNPLLLTLVTLLAKTTEEDIEKYAKLGIKRLKDIQNKADLYESVVRFILTKHAKETKGQDYDPEVDLTRWMDELGEYAYTFHSGHGESKQKPYYDQNLSILFRNLGTNQYEFIHYSFYEYFLARHLAHTQDGASELYKVRDANFESWNNWRNFRPVALYYGEMLGNSGDTDGLERLLGEEGLLQNDDIFGEGFFMGLEILCTLPEEMQKNLSVQEMMRTYEEMISKWNIEEVFYNKYRYIKKIVNNSKKVSSNQVISKIITRLLILIEQTESKLNIRRLTFNRASKEDTYALLDISTCLDEQILLSSQVGDSRIIEFVIEYLNKHTKSLSDVIVYKIYSHLLDTTNPESKKMVLESLNGYKEHVLSREEHKDHKDGMYILYLLIDSTNKDALIHFETTISKSPLKLTVFRNIFIDKLLTLDIPKESGLYAILYPINKEGGSLIPRHTSNLSKNQRSYTHMSGNMSASLPKRLLIAKERLMLANEKSNTHSLDERNAIDMAYTGLGKIIRFGTIDLVKECLELASTYYRSDYAGLMNKIAYEIENLSDFAKQRIILWIFEKMTNANENEITAYYIILLRIGDTALRLKIAQLFLESIARPKPKNSRELYYVYKILLAVGDDEFKTEARKGLLIYIVNLIQKKMTGFLGRSFELLDIKDYTLNQEIATLLVIYCSKEIQSGNIVGMQDIYTKLYNLGIHIPKSLKYSSFSFTRMRLDS